MTVLESDLKAYLSGGAANADPDASLGGAMSSVEVSLTALNNLFADVTGTQATNGAERHRWIYVRNESADAAGWINPVAWIGYQPRDPNDPYPLDGETYAFAVAAAKNVLADALVDEDTPPAGLTFYTVSSKATGRPLPSPDYMEGDYVGICLRMTTPALQPQNDGSEYQLCVEGDS